MQEALNTSTRVIRLAFYFNLILLLVAERSDSWSDIKVMLPWALAMATRDNRAHLLHIVLSHKWMVAASTTLALLMVGGCRAYACTVAEIDAALIPILWIPIAALIRSVKTDASVSIFVTAGIAVTATAIFIMWQFFVVKQERPAGFSFNVLSAPMILSMLCLMGAASANHIGQALQRWFYMVAAIGITAAILTDAKTGLLTFIVGTFIYMIANRGQAFKTFAVALPIILIWSISLSSKIQSIQVDIAHYDNNVYRTSFGERTDALRWGVEHILDDPVLGKGSDQVRDQFNQRWKEWGRPEKSITAMPHLHNDYLQITLSKGVPAFLSFMTLWIGLIANCARTALSDSGDNSSASWMLALIGIYLTAFMTDSFTHWNYTWAAVMASAGVAFGLVEKVTVPAKTEGALSEQVEEVENRFA